MKLNPIRQKVYKVVTRTSDERLISAVRNVRESEFCVTYVPQIITRPKVGKIFAFESCEAAQNFCERNQNQEVWECEAFGVKDSSLTNYNRLDIYRLYLMEKFWNTPDARELNGQKDSCPVYTVFCSSIRLLKKVA